MGLIIIVDTSDSSINNHKEIGAMRQNIIYVEKLPISKIESIEIFKPVFKRLEELNKKQLMQIFIGGIPYYYNNLLNLKVISGIKYKNEEEKNKMKSDHEIKINKIIYHFYSNSYERVDNMIIKNKHKIGFMDFLDKFKNRSNQTYIADNKEINLIHNIEHSCFRLVAKNDVIHIVAISNSVEIILKKQYKNRELQEDKSIFDIKYILTSNSVAELQSFLDIDLEKNDKIEKEVEIKQQTHKNNEEHEIEGKYEKQERQEIKNHINDKKI